MSEAYIHVTGNLGDDPQVEKVGDGQVTKFSLAVSQYRGKNREADTGWWRCECWGPVQKLLEFVGKGDQVKVRGDVVIDKGKDGKYYYNVRCDKVIIPKKGDSAGPSGGGGSKGASTQEDDDGW
jgi:single-stranded DNA-binding protein